MGRENPVNERVAIANHEGKPMFRSGFRGNVKNGHIARGPVRNVTLEVPPGRHH